ncbi:hypothetical protein K8S17_05080 [bacterium]|nr:hypothetical protein [bacterium]
MADQLHSRAGRTSLPRTRGGRTLRRYGVALILIAVAIVAAVLVNSRDSVRRLPDTFDYLPYRFALASPFDEARIHVWAADLDGDGVDEGVALSKNRRHDERFIGVFFIEESQRYTITQMNRSSACELMGVIDVTGDGQHELVWWEQRPEGIVEFVVTEFDTIAVDSGRHQIGSVLWDATGSLMEDGVWGGSGYVIDAFDRDGNGTRETLLLGVGTGIHLTPRGLWLMDWEAGKIVGRRETAATTLDGQVVDVDGDGIKEIVVGLESPGNGAVSEPFDDGHAYIAVFEKDLSLSWWRELTGYSARVSYVVADLDGDGSMEIATGVGGCNRDLEADFGLRVWNGATGEPLASVSYDVPVNDIRAILTSDGARICVGLADGRVLRNRYAEGVLTQDAEFRNTEGLRSVCAFDFGVPGTGQTLLLATANGTVILTDDGLRPLAAWRTEESIDTKSQITAAQFRVRDSIVSGMIFQTSKHLYYAYAERVPLPPWLRRAIDWLRSIASALLVAIATLLVAGAVLPGYRRRTIGALRRTLLPRRRREAELDEFIEQLKTGGHGFLSATKTLRRLASQLTMLSQHEGETPDAFTARYTEGVRNAREVGLPTVEALVASTAQLGLAPLHAADVRRAIAELHSIIMWLPDAPPDARDAEVARVQFERVLACVQDGLSAAREQAEREKSSVLAKELERVISSRAAELRRPGLSFERDGLDALGELRVLGTSAELTFVFDNLVGNALRAVQEETKAAIRVATVRADAFITVTVEDSGKGIDASEHERVFARGVSEKGGGHGLPRSREIVERRGGALTLVRSAPGEGAVFEVKLKAVADDA